MRHDGRSHPWRHLPSGPSYVVVLLILCADPLVDAWDIASRFDARVGSLVEVGLAHPGQAAAGLAIIEVTTSLLVLRGVLRRYGALILAALAATRGFIEARGDVASWHAGLAGSGPPFSGQFSIVAGFVLVAWLDFVVRRVGRIENESW